MSKQFEGIKRKDPEPVITRLETLVESIRDGKIKLPNFQRPFVWDRSDILNLMDSIYRGYPIGSILLWMTTERLASERSILEAIEIEQEETGFQSEYLLDGQQRLTSVCGVLFWNGKTKTNKWNVYFDLENEEFVYAENNIPINYFPLNKLLETRSFIKECLKFEHHENASIYYSRAESLLRAVKDYKIAVVKIGDMKLEEVAPVFERINSKGRVLTMLDLMRAATWKGGFDLTENINKTISEISRHGFGEINSDIVLKCMATSSGKGFNKADIDSLRNLNSQELFHSSEKAKSSLLKAFHFLKEVANITDESFISYFQQLILLAEFFHLHDQELSSRMKKELTSWFWSTSISKYFAGASTGQNNRDLKVMRSFANGEDISIHPFHSINLSELLRDDFNLRVANSSTMAAILNSMHLKSDLMGHNLEELEIKKSKDYFKSLVGSDSKYKANIFRVLCVGKNDPVNLDFHSIDEKILQQNLLDRKCLQLLAKNEIDAFIKHRSNLISNYIQSIINIKIVNEMF